MTARDFLPTDAEGAAQVYTRARPGHPATAGGLLHGDEVQRAAGAHTRRWVAEAGGQVVAVAEVLQPLGSLPTRAYWLELAVLEEARGQGLGAALYRAALHELTQVGAASVRVVVSETNPVALRFAGQRGYHEDGRYWDRQLDLRAYRPETYTALETCDALKTVPGAELLDLPTFQTRTPGWAPALHRAYEDARADLPRPDGERYTPGTLEQLRQWVLDDPNHLPGGFWLAVSGEAVLGFIALVATSDPATLEIAMTGTARDARGRGLATALKVRAQRWAKGAGYTRILTTNDHRNLPMLAVNDRLGYTRDPARLSFLRVLA